MLPQMISMASRLRHASKPANNRQVGRINQARTGSSVSRAGFQASDSASDARRPHKARLVTETRLPITLIARPRQVSAVDFTRMQTHSLATFQSVILQLTGSSAKHRAMKFGDDGDL